MVDRVAALRSGINHLKGIHPDRIEVGSGKNKVVITKGKIRGVHFLDLHFVHDGPDQDQRIRTRSCIRCPFNKKVV